MKKILLALPILFMTCTPLWAQNLIQNPGFESGTGSDFDPSQTITDWTLTGSVGRMDTIWNVLSGDFSAALNFGDSAPNGTLSQVIATTPGTQYSFSFLYANNGDPTQGPQTLGIEVDGAGGTGSLFSSSVDISDLNATLFSTTFTADSATTTVRFLDTPTNPTNAIDIVIDEVNVNAISSGSTAPEPGSLALLGMAALPVVGMIRRRKA